MSSASSSSNTSSHTENEECPYAHSIFWRNTYLTADTRRHLIALVIISLISAIPTILLNSLVIFAVATRRRLQTTSYILLACLATTDCLVGMVSYPVGIAADLKRILSVEPFCPVEKSLVATGKVLSLASLSEFVLISSDRFIAVKYSLRYQEIVTKNRIKVVEFLVLLVLVVLTIGETAIAVTNTKSVYMSASALTIGIFSSVCIVVITYIYCYFFFESRRHKKRIQTEQLSQEEAKRFKKNNKAIKTLAIILAVLALSYAPGTIGIFVTLLLFKTSEPGVVSVFWRWAATFCFFTSLANPVIYCWRDSKLRCALLEILRLKRQNGNRSPDIDRNEIQP